MPIDLEALRRRRRPDAAARQPPRATAGATPSALILTASIGGGHDALAAACGAALEGAGMTVRTVDVVASLGDGGAGSAVFRRAIARGSAYDAFHFGQLRAGGALAVAAERAALARATPAVNRLLGDQPADLVLSVFATGAGVGARLRAAGRCRSAVVFNPDAAAHRMWVHPQTDLFLATSTYGAATIRRYRPEAPVTVVAQPLRAGFAHPPTQPAARRALGLPADRDCVLVMGGAWGLGPVVDLSAALADAGLQVLAVAGRNERLLGALREAAATRPELHPVGYCDRIPELMAASDLVVTTPGVTCHEARAVGRGLVLLDVVPGHGRENLAHELELGAAAVSQATPSGVLRTVRACLDSDAIRRPAPDPAAAAAHERFLDALAPLGVLPPRAARTG